MKLVLHFGLQIRETQELKRIPSNDPVNINVLYKLVQDVTTTLNVLLTFRISSGGASCPRTGTL